MMTNLFSIFDPSSHIFNMNTSSNWISSWLILWLTPYLFWLASSRSLFLKQKLNSFMINEMFNILTLKNKMAIIFLLSLFFFILVNNILGLLPFVFTSSAHLAFTLPLALTMWVGYMSASIFSNLTNLLAHMVPQETPTPLMPFMVLIETLSSIIRPFTLAIRLSANMVAGHLLLALMSSSLSIMTPLTSLSISTLQILLMLLESAVAAIQAYVFTTLCTLYIQEA
uniref:ATP synthase F0 subunit 6 n=1 Tax=Elthusa poutassouiensis TaxID=3104314 RepID=UPI002E75B544|nr:ATP synthase F0 subunit 6 [Elthusa poutassouiensis]WPS93548.1 ATP synthase F0 subunit 6 [Elthusa poutassouiensis]